MCPFTRDLDGPTFATSAGITDGARFASQAEMRDRFNETHSHTVRGNSDSSLQRPLVS